MNTSKLLIFLFLMNIAIVLLGNLIAGAIGVYVALLLLAFTDVITIFYADRTMLYQFQANPMDGHALDAVKPLVQLLADKAKVPMPTLYLINEQTPNLFVVQSITKRGSIAVTSGLLNALNREELMSVLAYCVGHLYDRDAFIATATAVIAGGISGLALVDYAALFLSDNDDPPKSCNKIIMAIFGPVASWIVKGLSSSATTFRADHKAVQLCDHETGFISALGKLEAAKQRNGVILNAEIRPSSAHIFFISPLQDPKLSAMFSVLPSTVDRIAHLQGT